MQIIWHKPWLDIWPSTCTKFFYSGIEVQICKLFLRLSPSVTQSTRCFPTTVSLAQSPLSHLFLSFITILYVLPVYVCGSPLLSFLFVLSFFSLPLSVSLFRNFQTYFVIGKFSKMWFFYAYMQLVAHYVICTSYNIHTQHFNSSMCRLPAVLLENIPHRISF